ncbi:hypothetical protein LEP1GSC187_1504 [Leptospira santarosai str. ZUN179]|uniref:Uncharacterized protein n=1 Tax=Leptospira santarosai str. ZUN179 TaxID=1049985 RepID=M6UME2_9LEPT|nr:hypothetical protein LEP1GSC187_1504 [Leptospira santarosai str. ZUN179]
MLLRGQSPERTMKAYQNCRNSSNLRQDVGHICEKLLIFFRNLPNYL